MKELINNNEMKIMMSERLANDTHNPNNEKLGELVLKKTIDKFNLYRKIFNVDKLEKVEFIIFDKQEEYREFYRKLNKKELPEYAKGSFEPKINLSYSYQQGIPLYKSSLWYNFIANPSHEAFHLYYKKYIYKDERIVWFDEGLAQYFSGERDMYLESEEKLRELFTNFKDSYKPISNLNERIQGNNDISDDLIFERKNVFSGYNVSFLIIKYIVDNYGEEYLITLMKDNNKIRTLGNTAINDMLEYYTNKYNLNTQKTFLN